MRTSFLTVALSVALVLAFAAPGMAATTYEFKIAHIEGAGGAGEKAFYHLQKILQEKSKGQIKVTVYKGKSMAQSDTELGEIVRQGTVQMVPVPTHTLSAMANIPQYSVFEFPYLFTDWNDIYKVLDSNLAKGWAKVLEKDAGVVVYGGFVKGWLSIGTKRGPISTPGELKGLKIRTMATDMQMGLISALGASPAVVAYGELYTAQQQGMVDGMLTATTLYRTDKFAEVINHLSIIRATAHFHLPTINKKWLDSLTPELRAIFDECMKEYVAFGREAEKELNEAVIAAMDKEFKVKVRMYTEAELVPFKAAVKPMWEKFYDKPGKGVIDEVLRFLGKDFKTLLQ